MQEQSFYLPAPLPSMLSQQLIMDLNRDGFTAANVKQKNVRVHFGSLAGSSQKVSDAWQSLA